LVFDYDLSSLPGDSTHASFLENPIVRRLFPCSIPSSDRSSPQVCLLGIRRGSVLVDSYSAHPSLSSHAKVRFLSSPICWGIIHCDPPLIQGWSYSPVCNLLTAVLVPLSESAWRAANEFLLYPPLPVYVKTLAGCLVVGLDLLCGFQFPVIHLSTVVQFHEQAGPP